MVSTKKNAVSGLLWTFGQQFSSQAINFIIQIALARLLGPKAFGLVGMILIINVVGNTLTDSGLTSSLIRTKDVTTRDYSTVFWVNLFVGVCIYIIVFLIAPYVAAFYNESILTSLIRTFSLSIIIRAFYAVQNTKLTKEMNFKSQLVMQLPSVALSGCVGLILAYKGFGVWSLVYMNLLQVLLATLFHWIFTPWKPSFIFDKILFYTHFRFGYKLALSSLMHNLYLNLYTVLIGKFFSVQQVGYYNQADNLRSFPIRQITTAIDKVSYPLFANVQNDNAKLKYAYKRIMQQIIFWLTPLMVLLALIAKPLFILVLSPKWEGAVVYFQILCLASIFTPLTVYNLNILNVKGRSDLVFKLSILKYIISIVGIIGLYRFGILALVYFQFFITYVNFFINSFYSGKMIGYTSLQQIKDVISYYIFGLFLGLFLYYILIYVRPYIGISEISWSNLLLTSILFLSVYFTISHFIKLIPLVDFFDMVRDFKK